MSAGLRLYHILYWALPTIPLVIMRTLKNAHLQTLGWSHNLFELLIHSGKCRGESSLLYYVISALLSTTLRRGKGRYSYTQRIYGI